MPFGQQVEGLFCLISRHFPPVAASSNSAAAWRGYFCGQQRNLVMLLALSRFKWVARLDGRAG
jgi:hypothetical protein